MESQQPARGGEGGGGGAMGEKGMDVMLYDGYRMRVRIGEILDTFLG